MLVGQPLVAAAGSQPPPLEAVAPKNPAGPAARRVLDRIAHDQGAALAQPAALWGYESVRVVLDAIRAAQRGGRRAKRRAVVRAALRPRSRSGPIGDYRVRRNGAVEGLPLALYRLSGDRFEDVRTLLLRADCLRVKARRDAPRCRKPGVGLRAVRSPIS